MLLLSRPLSQDVNMYSMLLLLLPANYSLDVDLRVDFLTQDGILVPLADGSLKLPDSMDIHNIGLLEVGGLHSQGQLDLVLLHIVLTLVLSDDQLGLHLPFSNKVLSMQMDSNSSGSILDRGQDAVQALLVRFVACVALLVLDSLLVTVSLNLSKWTSLLGLLSHTCCLHFSSNLLPLAYLLLDLHFSSQLHLPLLLPHVLSFAPALLNLLLSQLPPLLQLLLLLDHLVELLDKLLLPLLHLESILLFCQLPLLSLLSAQGIHIGRHGTAAVGDHLRHVAGGQLLAMAKGEGNRGSLGGRILGVVDQFNSMIPDSLEGKG